MFFSPIRNFSQSQIYCALLWEHHQIPCSCGDKYISWRHFLLYLWLSLVRNSHFRGPIWPKTIYSSCCRQLVNRVLKNTRFESSQLVWARCPALEQLEELQREEKQGKKVIRRWEHLLPLAFNWLSTGRVPKLKPFFSCAFSHSWLRQAICLKPCCPELLTNSIFSSPKMKPLKHLTILSLSALSCQWLLCVEISQAEIYRTCLVLAAF